MWIKLTETGTEAETYVRQGRINAVAAMEHGGSQLMLDHGPLFVRETPMQVLAMCRLADSSGVVPAEFKSRTTDVIGVSDL